MPKLVKKPIAIPSIPVSPTASMVETGIFIPPIERLKHFSDKEWENFILEWVDSLRTQYGTVERCGGSGDMGRDVIATDIHDANIWDNYQCKHYDHPLAPHDIWIEIGKLIYYTKINEFSLPRKYYFIAPQGAGTKLSNLLKKVDKIREGIKSNWAAKCQDSITKTTKVMLDSDLESYVDAFDFTIFEAIPPLRIIEQHQKTRWFVYRFGGGLPTRPTPPTPPSNLEPIETNYVQQLFEAYADYLKTGITKVTDLASNTQLTEHFNNSRIEFYSAESLRVYSRENLPLGEFEKLQEEIFSGIVDEIHENHPHGFKRLTAVIKLARTLQITSHSLITQMHIRDRGGICHQLANAHKVRWVK